MNRKPTGSKRNYTIFPYTTVFRSEDGLRIDKTSGSTPLTVSLDAGESSDPDHDALEYLWLIGEKQVASTTTPEWTTELKEAGQYRISVKVSDGKGDTAASHPVTEIGRASCRDGVCQYV